MMLRLFDAHRTTLITIYSAVDISDRMFVDVYDMCAAATRRSDTHHGRRSTCTNINIDITDVMDMLVE